MFRKSRVFAVIITALFVLFYSLPADSGQSEEKQPEVISTDELPKESAQAESLRQELETEIDAYNFMGTITRVGTAPNVTNDHVQVDHWIRNSDRSGAEAIARKVEQLHTMARGAAMSTFTDVEINHYASDRNGIETAWLQALQWYYTNHYGDASAISEELDDPVGWDESGTGAANVPGVHIRPAVAGVPDAAGHSFENAAITISSEGHKGLEQIAKIGTAVALRLVLEPELRAKVKEEFAQWQKYGLAAGMISEDMLRKR